MMRYFLNIVLLSTKLSFPQLNILWNSSQVKIFDIQGELIKTISSDIKTEGENEITWDGTNDFGVKQPSGVYVYQLNSNVGSGARKMILLK